MNEKRISELMRLLDISREEAIDVIKSDDAIDHGEKLFELSADQKKAEKEMRTTTSAVNAYGRKVTRTKKSDNDKAYLIEVITHAIENVIDEKVTVTNAEREINFSFGGRKFKVVLSAPRK